MYVSYPDIWITENNRYWHFYQMKLLKASDKSGLKERKLLSNKGNVEQCEVPLRKWVRMKRIRSQKRPNQRKFGRVCTWEWALEVVFIQLQKKYGFSITYSIIFPFFGDGRGVWMTSNGSLWNVTFFMFFRMSYKYLFYRIHRAAVLQSSQKFRQRNFCINISTLFYLFLRLFFLPFIFQVWNNSKMNKKNHFPWGEHIQMES